MRKLFSIFTILFLLLVNVNAQSKLGDVACVYITTPNLDSSVAVYEKIGFSKINSNDYPSPWTQVSDGSLLIMLRKDNNPFIGLTYYANDIDKTIALLEKDSIVFSQKPKEGDVLKRYVIQTPDGFTVTLVNNLGNFTQPKGPTLISMEPQDFNMADKYPNKQCGAFGEFAQPVKDVKTSVAFWKKLGFKTSSTMNEPYPYVILSDGLMLIGLHQTNDFNYPAITYFGINTEQRVQQLKEKGVKDITEMMGKKNIVLKTWEGQHIFIFSVGM